jgi:Outer membrane protein beta-barrel domain
MKKRMMWLSATALALMAARAGAGDNGQFRVMPSLGFAHVKVDGQHLEFGETTGYDGWAAGISAGYRAPFGLVVELGMSAYGEPIFGWATGGELRERYGAVGYDFEFGDGWHVTPKVGLTSWRLKGGELEDLIDDAGELRDELDDDDVHFELSLAKEFNPHVGIGLSFKQTNVDFGSARSVTCAFIWTL